ncbi:14260_t:CDS:1, partial [Racocetra persica]
EGGITRMLTNFNQSPVTDDEVIDQDPEIDNEREEQISANTSYSYVDPELCQR